MANKDDSNLFEATANIQSQKWCW